MGTGAKTMAYHRALLSISLTATGKEAKAAYHKACLAAHPDKSGSSEKMAGVNTAWDAHTGKDTIANDCDDDADNNSDIIDANDDEGYYSGSDVPVTDACLTSDSEADFTYDSHDGGECAFDDDDE